VARAYFYLWRLTREKKKRNWAWDVALAIEKIAKASRAVRVLKMCTRNSLVKMICSRVCSLLNFSSIFFCFSVMNKSKKIS